MQDEASFLLDVKRVKIRVQSIKIDETFKITKVRDGIKISVIGASTIIVKPENIVSVVLREEKI
jgi:hypothetical protein